MQSKVIKHCMWLVARDIVGLSIFYNARRKMRFGKNPADTHEDELGRATKCQKRKSFICKGNNNSNRGRKYWRDSERNDG